MKSMRLHGKIGDHVGIVHIKGSSLNGVWVVQLDTSEPTNLKLATLKYQVS